jgi:hypothetical protein
MCSGSAFFAGDFLADAGLANAVAAVNTAIAINKTAAP